MNNKRLSSDRRRETKINLNQIERRFEFLESKRAIKVILES
jgi:hypothetical protein